MKYIIVTILMFAVFTNCTNKPQTAIEDTPNKYVNAFTGTSGEGKTYPGAVLPFGMVQLSPDNGSFKVVVRPEEKRIKKNCMSVKNHKYVKRVILNLFQNHIIL
jgi:hypothetical protein